MKMLESGLRVRVYPVLCEAVEAGVLRGWRRAFKHEDSPSEATIRTSIEEAVIGEMCERFSVVDGDSS